RSASPPVPTPPTAAGAAVPPGKPDSPPTFPLLTRLATAGACRALGCSNRRRCGDSPRPASRWTLHPELPLDVTRAPLDRCLTALRSRQDFLYGKFNEVAVCCFPA